MSQIFKILSVLYLLSFLITSSYAQKGNGIQILVQPGISRGGEYEIIQATSSPDYYLANKMQKATTFGIQEGILLNHFFNAKVGIDMGVFYAHQGQNYNEYTWTLDNYSSTSERGLVLNYLKFPIQFEFIYSPENKFSFTFSAGFYFAYLLNFDDENTEITSEGTYQTSIATQKGITTTFIDRYGTIYHGSNTFEIKPYNKLDLGGITSLGLQFKVSDKISVPLTFNYEYSFTNAKNESSLLSSTGRRPSPFWQAPNDNIPYHNSWLGLKTGLRYHF